MTTHKETGQDDIENLVAPRSGTQHCRAPYEIVTAANFVKGCSNDCLYCTARRAAGWPSDWNEMKVLPGKVERNWPKLESGAYMVPSMHDITPSTVDAAVRVLRNIASNGSHISIYTKAHLEVMRRLCDELAEFRHLVRMRVTITAMDDSLLAFWEPGAPPFAERLEALRLAHARGFRTAVSATPLLDSNHAEELFRVVEPYVTEVVVIGRLQLVSQLRLEFAKMPVALERLEEVARGQTEERILEIHEKLKGEPKFRWHHDLKKQLGLTYPKDYSSEAPAIPGQKHM